MKLEKINLVDIFPNQKNPRQKFDGIEELAESFENGEPFTPIAVAKDGGIYTLIDGERRYRAMKLLKTKKCNALIAENQDEADTLIAMVSTNNKQQLTPVEISRGIQQALLFTDVERVEKASGKKNLELVKRAAQLVDDAAADMSLDRLLAIEANADNSELVEKLTYCSEGEWRSVLASYIGTSDDPEDEAASIREQLHKTLQDASLTLSALEQKGHELTIYEQKLSADIRDILRRR